jgi:hypothetical protein
LENAIIIRLAERASWECSKISAIEESIGIAVDQKIQIENFRNLAPSNEKQFFLACLWAWKELSNR